MPNDCATEAKAQEALIYAEKKSKEDFGCIKRCSWEKFTAGEVDYMSKSVAPMEIGQDEFHLVLMYDEMKVTLVKEFFIYDGIDMVMAVGGILAFFLGFSLLSVLLDCVDVISRACGHE